MNNVYFFSYRRCAGPVGGGQGVTYKICAANKKLSILEHVKYCFKNIVIENPEDYTSDYTDKNKKQKKDNARKAISSKGISSLLFGVYRFKKAKKWVRDIVEKFKIDQSDICIFQDIEAAYGFVSQYTGYRTALVYHQQGGLYYEWKSFNNTESEVYHKFLLKKMKFVFSHVEKIAFPSNGAKEALMQTEPMLSKNLSNKKINILYNGFDRPDSLSECDPSIEKVVERLECFNGIKFITVSSLNHAKGVDRIPPFLSSVKKSGYDFIWVLVGNGADGDSIDNQITTLRISDNCIWIKSPIKHDDVLRLFSLSDFYIMFHRFSIFDFATIEAMSYGNAPILSDVGGNKEVVEKNGLLLNDLKDSKSFCNFLSNNDSGSLRESNITLQKSRFGMSSFLRRYKALIDSMK